jgi:hypothetical protein
MTPESMIATLDAGVPVALLPVRIETRFMTGATELRVRVYPDPLHIDTHEPELTAAEVTAGKAYWNERWAAPADTARATTAWNELVRSFEPRRALWIVEALKPTNLAQLGTAATPSFPTPPGKLQSWSRAAYAALLPRQWVAVGGRDGVEVFRKAGAQLPDRLIVGPDPNAVDEPAPADALPLDEATRWLTDYDSAVAVGMGITIREADVAGGLAGGFDQLIVIGVDGALPAADGALAVTDLIRTHLYTDGLGFLRPGTPTNNTEAARTGDPDPDAALTRELDPVNPAVLEDRSSGRALERALGLAPDSADLAHASHVNLFEQRTVALLLDVLWPSTLGYYLDQLMDPLLDDATIEQVRAFARESLQPAGPLPVLRVGKQPYGVLPIVAPSRLPPAAAGGIADRLHGVLLRLRPFWNAAAARVPRLGATGDPDTELLQLLQMTPQSAVARFRRVIGPELEPNTQGLAAHARAQQYFATLVLQLALGLPSLPRVASFTADPRNHQLRVPWVQKDGRDDAPLEPNYLTTIAQTARSTGGRALLDQRNNSGTLLEALAANATLNELDHAAARVVTAHQLKLGALSAKPARVAFRSPEAVRIASPTPAPTSPGSPGPVRVDTPRDLHQLVLPLTTGSETVGDWISNRIRAGSTPPVELRDLVAFLGRLDELATRPAGEIDRALRGLLDCFSHRLDAWYTALATARLAALREQQPLGIHVGGYGWVEALHPDTTPDSLGYVHAPSLEQASAAAILRSGHLAHRDSEHESLNIDLRSDRVRLALDIMEGVARGQSLAALLGYRIERALRDRDPRLARFIAPLRRLAPLRPIVEGTVTVPTEAIAARDVVDGVALLERWRASESGVLDALNVSGIAERSAVSAELNRLADTLDAVSDLLVAESVYQTTAGNPERARAALAVLDRQERPIEPMVVRTPRTGVTYAQRLLVLLTENSPPAPWTRLTDVRATAEPRLNAWIARVLGDPARYRFAGRIVTDNKPVRTAEVRLRQLGLSPLSLVLAARRGGPNQPSELEERVAQLFAAALEPDDQNPRLEIDPGPPAGVGNAVGLGPLLVQLEWLGNLVGQRAADARDLALAENLVEPGIDGAELAARADAAVAMFDTALRRLEAALRARQPTERALRTALTLASAAGAQHAVPRAIVPIGQSADLPAAVLASLLELGNAVLERMRVTDAALTALEEAFDATSASPESLIEHHVARIHALFGNDFPVLPRFTVLNSAELGASLAEQDALCAGDPLAPGAWLQRMALVRPDTDRLQRVFTAAELLDVAVPPADFRIAQLPHQSGQRWAALPQEPNTAVDADLALALHAPGTLDFTASLAGLVCDDWAETIPAAEQVTGLSFHYDAPGARAPNTVLVAVAADPQASTWGIDELVDVVREAAALAKLRLVGPRQLDRLGILLPTTYLPDNFKHDVPSIDVTKLTANVAAGVGVLGKTT